MAIGATSSPIGRLRGSTGRTGPLLRYVRPSDGIRDDAERVVLTTSDALAPVMEGIAACDEALAAFDRVVMAALGDAPMAVVAEAQRAMARLLRMRGELRRMAGLIEPPDPAAAEAAA